MSHHIVSGHGLTSITDALTGLAGAPRTPPRVQRACQSLIARLNAPVRIGLFGLPGSGKRALLDALCGTRLATLGPVLPTLELAQGSPARTNAVLADGSSLQQPGPPSADLLMHGPAFLSIHLPQPELAGRQWLLLATEAQEADLIPALNWAAERVDMVLWCSTGWTAMERRVWRGAPDNLRNHAVLIMTGPPQGTDIDSGSDGFQTRLTRDPGQPDAALAQIAGHLDRTLEEAALQDRLAAQMFLQRHGGATRTSVPMHREAPAAAPPHTARPAPTPVLTVADAPPPVAPEARAELGRLFQFTRNAADGLRRDLCAPDLADAPAEMTLARLDSVFETLADRAMEMDHLADTWPDLPETLGDARDLALLMRMEGGQAQAADAARLLLQLRHEMEHRLAA